MDTSTTAIRELVALLEDKAQFFPNSPGAKAHAMLVELAAEKEATAKVLLKVNRLFDEALPKFNWGASALDANAIGLLNETPSLVRAALKVLK